MKPSNLADAVLADSTQELKAGLVALGINASAQQVGQWLEYLQLLANDW